MNENKTTWLIIIMIIIIVGFGAWYFLKPKTPPPTPTGFTGLSDRDIAALRAKLMEIKTSWASKGDVPYDNVGAWFQIHEGAFPARGKMTKEQVENIWTDIGNSNSPWEIPWMWDFIPK